MKEPFRAGLFVAFVLLSIADHLAPIRSEEWITQALVDTSDIPNDISFGSSLAISPSGEKLVVGASWEKIGGNSKVGSLWVYQRDTTGGWAYQTKLMPSLTANSKVGDLVHMTENHIFSGSLTGYDGRGEIYPFTRSGDTWTVKQRITRVGGTTKDEFGRSMASDGDLLVVGCISCLSDAGEVSLFTINGSGEWVILSSLSKSGAKYLGYSVSLSPKLIAASAPGISGDLGCLYIWSRSGSTIDATPAKLTTLSPLDEGTSFGIHIAIVSDTMVIARTLISNIYVFTFDSEWVQSSFVAMEPLGFAMFSRAAFLNPYYFVSDVYKIYVYTLSGDTLSSGTVLSAHGEVLQAVAAQLASSGATLVVSQYLDPPLSVSTFTIPPSPKVSTFHTSAKSKSEKLGYRVAMHNEICLVSVPFCVDTDTSCDGGYLLMYSKNIEGDFIFADKLRNPYCNRDNKFGYFIQSTSEYLIISAPDSVYESSPSGIIVFYSWGSAGRRGEIPLIVKDSILRYRKTDEDYDLGSAFSNMGAVTAVGMPEYDEDAKANAGCTHIFQKKDNGKWGQRKRISAPSPIAEDRFGRSVALQSVTRVAISNDPADPAQLGVFIYNLFEGEWIHSQTLSDVSKPKFGFKVAFFDDLLYVSALGDATISGSITIYKDDGQGLYDFPQKLTAKGGAYGENFGHSFATDGVRLVVGAASCLDGSQCGVMGSVYTFTKRAGNDNWFQQYHYRLGVEGGSDGFGFEVAIVDDTVAVSAPFDATKSRKGAIHFVRNNQFA